MTIREKLENLTNDYSFEEETFFNYTNQRLQSVADFPLSTDLSVSVVIPAYNAHHTLPFVLNALSKQTFTQSGGNLEVLVVDDASSTPILYNPESHDYPFLLRYIRFKENRGAGAARDTAISASTNQIIVFIDADIWVHSSFLSNHVFAHKHLQGNNLLVNFRKNLHFKNMSDFEIVTKPISTFDDHRMNMVFKKEWVMRAQEERLVGQEFHLLNKTNQFKEFGYNTKIELWTLPMMVLTCAMSGKRESIIEGAPTPSDLHGWGFNDTCMVAKIMAKTGAKVIPLMNSNVLHIIEDKHTKKDETKNKEYLQNEQVYEKLLEEEA